MALTPYLQFDGNAAQALAHYAEILGGKVVSSMTYGEIPDSPSWVTDANKDRLANGVLVFDDAVIMASDTGGSEPFKGYSGITLQMDVASFEQGKVLFDKLSKGGNVTMAYDETFWAAGFGMCTDAFGVPWMINCSAD